MMQCYPNQPNREVKNTVTTATETPKPSKKQRKSWMFVLLTIVTLSGTGFTFYDDFFAVARNIELLGRVYREVAENYVDDINVSEFMMAGIDGMLSTLDPYTVFMDEEQADDLEQLTTGKYAGVGISINVKDNQVIVMSVAEGYSAEKAGVRIGDVIISIDGQDVRGRSVLDIRNLIKGDINTEVQISVEREGLPKPISFQLVRHDVVLKNVTHVDLGKDGIGYVDIQRFSVKAAEELEDAIFMLQDSAKARKTQMKGLILDLRDNPGGLLDVAVSVAGKFVKKGSTIVTTRGRDSVKVRSYVSTTPPLLKDLPVVVLINKSSASASEIVAGAVQDLDRGVIVGTRSFGKGLVQTITRLPYNTSLKITTAKYYTPSGRLIQEVDYFHRNKLEGKRDVFRVEPDTIHNMFRTKNGRPVYDGGGIAPDLAVDDRELSEFELQLLRKSLFFKFANRFRAEHPSLPANFTITEDILKPFKAFLKEQGFFYESPTSQLIEDLQASLTSGNYPSEVSKKLAELKTLVEQEENNEFSRQKLFILNQLEQEIYVRYDQRKAYLASLKFDQQFHEAVRLLSDANRYQQCLSGKNSKRN
ncbi:carboxyl-terminal protease [Chloroherpeton thalassium ATCC 35110]|uniref:Carboxyl-terminal protease n=1 Tax=Chloroherpeton thalassium (strain ATCC 35110 / GB-78) TaxID=517418 RepID=B3QVM0_CHLT3|nr:S41 family peptidase [Chloroherpeton thalassium]ACF13077.1 carboxyl-terminal protease [Chloroherpeton thalassium ATCC 35110]